MNVDQTIQVLSKMVKKTPLTQKLLSKPPFRYLHDLVSEMMKNTGLFVGLFDEREMNHENVKEKDAKIQYLQKLVDAVTALGQETKLNPLKVVAGYEPEETNAFLQLLGELALQKVNTQDAVKRVLSKQERPDSKQSRGSKSDLTQTRSESKPEKVEAKPEREVKSEKVDQKPEKVEAKVEKVEQKQEKVEHKTEKAEQKPEKVEKHERSDSKHDKPERQEKPEKHDKPDRQEKHDRLEKADAKESHSRTASKKEEEEQLEPEEAPPAEEPQPVRSRMRPVTARHAPPKPKKEQAPVQEPIKQQVAILSDGQHKGEDDDEFVVKVAETKQETTVNGQEQHGGLVKKILQSKKEDEPQKPKKQTGVKEIEELQEAIQKLCQSTNPLGKTMDYIQEDVDAMNKEFELWRRECQSLTLQAQEQITTETLAPLEMQLKQVEDLIEEQLDKISAEKASIFQVHILTRERRNDSKAAVVHELCAKMSLDKLKIKLKDWEARFTQKYNRKPEKKDIQERPEIAEKYHEYRRLKKLQDQSSVHKSSADSEDQSSARNSSANSENQRSVRKTAVDSEDQTLDTKSAMESIGPSPAKRKIETLLMDMQSLAKPVNLMDRLMSEPVEQKENTIPSFFFEKSLETKIKPLDSSLNQQKEISKFEIQEETHGSDKILIQSLLPVKKDRIEAPVMQKRKVRRFLSVDSVIRPVGIHVNRLHLERIQSMNVLPSLESSHECLTKEERQKFSNLLRDIGQEVEEPEEEEVMEEMPAPKKKKINRPNPKFKGQKFRPQYKRERSYVSRPKREEENDEEEAWMQVKEQEKSVDFMLFDEPGEGLTQVVLFDKTKYVDLLSCLSIHGLASFREGQEQVIMNILQGKSTMAVLPTGHGKSLLYQLPTFIFSLVDPDCYTLVISPTISLMNDQMRCLPPHLGGLMITGDDISALEHVKQRKCKVLFVSPEKLMNKHFLELLQSPDMPSITLGCVDEVHCMSEWSHNFRSAYLHLPQIFEQLQITNILCLTGTATKTIADYCTRVFKIEHLITSKIMRSNLYPHIIPTEADQRDAVLVELLKSEFRKKSVIIYVSFQHQADQLAQHLRLRSLNAESYHAGKPSKQRLFLQQEFTIGRIDVLVCTVAFGLGVNKSNVDTVIHYTMPKSLENYVQEIGRAGRDGRICECFCFLVKDDYILQRSLCFQDSITNSQLQMLLDRLLKTGEEICFISANDCEQQLDIKPSMVESVLSYLELAFDHLKKQKTMDGVITCYTSKDELDPFFQGLATRKNSRGGIEFHLFQAAIKLKKSPFAIMSQLRSLQAQKKIRFVTSEKCFWMTVKSSNINVFETISDKLERVQENQVKKLDTVYHVLSSVGKSLEAWQAMEPTRDEHLESVITQYFQDQLQLDKVKYGFRDPELVQRQKLTKLQVEFAIKDFIKRHHKKLDSGNISDHRQSHCEDLSWIIFTQIPIL